MFSCYVFVVVVVVVVVCLFVCLFFCIFCFVLFCFVFFCSAYFIGLFGRCSRFLDPALDASPFKISSHLQ